MAEEFVSEAIEPIAGTANAAAMTRREPGFPARFRWRGREYRLAQVLETWKQDGPCRNGSREMYLRKHWYKIRTEDNLIMSVYFERQARGGGQGKKRWWLFTVDRDGAAGTSNS
ncbi:MAG: cytoplasmic protein [Phycisphaerae bacterium]|nr:cytoplasmic protein [Phycisphaerae bacterium]